MRWRPGAIAIARASNGLFFLAVAAYCFVAYTPFVYELFLKPGVVPALSDFVAVSPWLFSATLLITVLTLMPQLSGANARGGAAAWPYVIASAVVASDCAGEAASGQHRQHTKSLRARIGGARLAGVARGDREFPQRNTLMKLLEANDYQRLMDIDVHVEALVTKNDRLVNLDPARGTMDLDLCATMPTLERTLSETRTRPVFFYSLSQNVHLAVAPKRPVPPRETYPAGFNPRTASSLRRLDACLGGFVAFLKREHLYDDSIIIFTSDHGDSLGEAGRRGHAFWMYPEVMNIPLIVHIPSRLRASVRADLDALVFSTDIVPSWYALLGYEPKDLGPLFGRSFFTPRDGDSARRRREPYLVASSYGAVYGVVSQNGRRIYVVDTVNRSEYAIDMSAEPRPVAVTSPLAAANRRLMKDQLTALATMYHYQP